MDDIVSFKIDNLMSYKPNLTVKVKILSDTATLPTYGSDKAAGMDLYADVLSMGYSENGEDKCSDKVYIAPGGCLKIPTGLAFQPPKGYCGMIYARSGLSTKKGLRPANAVGIVDEDYTGNVIVALYNDSNEIQVVEQGDRIAQLIFTKYEQFTLNVVDNLTETSRGSGGFGSSGV